MIREVPVTKLITALNRLHRTMPGCTLVKNSVGNLAVLDPRGEYIGFVDLGDGTITILPDDQRRGSINGR